MRHNLNPKETMMKLYTVQMFQGGAVVVEVDAKETENFYTFANTQNPWYQTRIAKRGLSAGTSREAAIRVAQEQNAREIATLTQRLANAQFAAMQLEMLASQEVK
jgi:hypothetical protein